MKAFVLQSLAAVLLPALLAPPANAQEAAASTDTNTVETMPAIVVKRLDNSVEVVRKFSYNDFVRSSS